MNRAILNKIKKFEKKLGLRQPEFLVFTKWGDSPLTFQDKDITEAEKEEIIKESKKRTGIKPHIIDSRIEFVSAKKQTESSL